MNDTISSEWHFEMVRKRNQRIFKLRHVIQDAVDEWNQMIRDQELIEPDINMDRLETIFLRLEAQANTWIGRIDEP